MLAEEITFHTDDQNDRPRAVVERCKPNFQG